MWTHTGFFLEKRDGQVIVYASDEHELKIFTTENGIINDFFIPQISDAVKEDGLYQCIAGYGAMGGNTDPCIYTVKKIGEITWAKETTGGTRRIPEHERRRH